MAIAKDEIIAVMNAFHDTAMYRDGDAEALGGAGLPSARRHGQRNPMCLDLLDQIPDAAALSRDTRRHRTIGDGPRLSVTTSSGP